MAEYEVRTLQWPERPLCHGEGPYSIWREPRSRRGPEDPYEETYQTCGYCGSIHPRDLYNLLKGQPVNKREEFVPPPGDHSEYTKALAEHYRQEAARGVRLGGSDWKYSWPHKLYVHNIPNPAAGQELITYSYGGDPSTDPDLVEYQRSDGVNGYRKVYSHGECPKTMQAKWYNEHLMDLTPETFGVMSDLIYLHTSIRFENRDGSLHYSAPYRGYQA